LPRKTLISISATALLLACAAAYQQTPAGSHIQERVVELLQKHHAPLLSSSSIPPMLIQAVLATEDERFYQHRGIDPIAVARAALFDASHACWCQGGSTITQQLVKLAYLHGSDRGPGKLVDAAVAVKVEGVIDKAQILADYLSLIPTGPDLYGVAQASCAYFSRPVDKVQLSDFALLAGLTQAPSLYDPLIHPSAARLRRQEVLADMVANRDITYQQANMAATQPLTLAGGSAAC